MKAFVVSSCAVVALFGTGVAQACSVSLDFMNNPPPGMVFSTLHCKFVPAATRYIPPPNFEDYVRDWKPIIQPVKPIDPFARQSPTLVDEYLAKKNHVITWPKEKTDVTRMQFQEGASIPSFDTNVWTQGLTQRTDLLKKLKAAG